MKRKRTWLAALRGERSQKEVAEALLSRGAKCSRSLYSLVELGLRDPSPELARAIAEFYGITMEAVFFGHEGYRPQPDDTCATKEAASQ